MQTLLGQRIPGISLQDKRINSVLDESERQQIERCFERTVIEIDKERRKDSAITVRRDTKVIMWQDCPTQSAVINIVSLRCIGRIR